MGETGRNKETNYTVNNSPTQMGVHTELEHKFTLDEKHNSREGT